VKLISWHIGYPVRSKCVGNAKVLFRRLIVVIVTINDIHINFALHFDLFFNRSVKSKVFVNNTHRDATHAPFMHFLIN
jgi:hypothetical protein